MLRRAFGALFAGTAGAVLLLPRLPERVTPIVRKPLLATKQALRTLKLRPLVVGRFYVPPRNPRKPKPAPSPTPVPIPTPIPPSVVLVPERWKTDGQPLALILQPIDFTAEHMAAVDEAAQEWNATGYVRLTLNQPIADDPNTTDPPKVPYGTIPMFYEPSAGLDYVNTNVDGEGYINWGWIACSPTVYYDPSRTYDPNAVYDPQVPPNTFPRIIAHELGHIFGLVHNDEWSIMGNWAIPAPTSYDLQQMALRGYARA